MIVGKKSSLSCSSCFTVKSILLRSSSSNCHNFIIINFEPYTQVVYGLFVLLTMYEIIPQPIPQARRAEINEKSSPTSNPAKTEFPGKPFTTVTRVWAGCTTSIPTSLPITTNMPAPNGSSSRDSFHAPRPLPPDRIACGFGPDGNRSRYGLRNGQLLQFPA